MASSYLGDNLHDWTWGVPRIGVMLAPLAKQFHHLREIYNLGRKRQERQRCSDAARQ